MEVPMTGNKKRGRPPKGANANSLKPLKETGEENLRKLQTELQEKEEVLNKAKLEVAILKARLKIEELDETEKIKFLKRQDMAFNYIKCICSLEEIEDVLDKLGINIATEEKTECETNKGVMESVDSEATGTSEENS